MSRKNLWLTLSLFAFGTIGGVFYNYYYLPLDSEKPGEYQAVSNSDDGLLSHGRLNQETTQLDPATGQAFETDGELSSTTAQGNSLHKGSPFNKSEVSSQASLVSEGDRYLLAGNFYDSHRLYARVNDRLQRNGPCEILFKLGLSAELAGQFDTARNFYASTVRKSSRRQNVRLLASIGLARIKIQLGETKLADEVLSELFLRHEGDRSLPHEVAMQLKSQLARSAQRQFVEQKKNHNDVHLEFTVDQLNLQATIQAVHPSTEVENGTENANSESESTPGGTEVPDMGLRLLQRPSHDAELIAMDAFTSTLSIRDTLSQLAGLAELKFKLDSHAEFRIRGRSTKLNVSGVSLALILDNVAKPLDLVWHQSGDVIEFSDREHSPNTGDFDFLSASRAQRSVALEPEPDERRLSALLALGNLNLLANHFDQASLFFEQLSQLNPNGEILASLTFNRATMERLLGRHESATRLFYEAIDQTLDFHLQSIAYYMVSNLQLRNDDIEQAIQSSSRSLSLASDHKVRQDAALTLARAYLLNNDPFSANKVLFENFEELKTRAQNRVVEFLGSFSRYLGTNDKTNYAKSRERLVISLATIEDSDLETIFDKVIASRAFYEMGFKERSTQLLKMAINEITVERWQRKIAFQLAIQQFDDANNSEAIKQLAQLAVDSSDAVGQNATLRLAQDDLRHKRYQETLERCRMLTRTASDLQTIREALKTMGSAYRSLDQHMSAAVCFSGMVPEVYFHEAPAKQNSGYEDR